MFVGHKVIEIKDDYVISIIISRPDPSTALHSEPEDDGVSEVRRMTQERNPLEEEDPLLGLSGDILGVSDYNGEDCTIEVVEFESETKLHAKHGGELRYFCKSELIH